MFRRFSTNFAALSILLDAALATAALLLATTLRSTLSFLPFVQQLGQVELPNFLYLLFPFVWVNTLLLLDVYDGRKNFRVWDEFGNLTLGAILVMVTLAGLLYLTYRDVSRFLFLSAIGLSYVLLLAWRVVARLIFRKHGLHSQMRRVIILGAGPLGQQVAESIRTQPTLGLTLVGFLDRMERDSANLPGSTPILGPIEMTRKIVVEREIEDVIFALPADDHQRVTEMVCALEDLAVHTWIIPDTVTLALHQAKFEEFGGIPMLDLRAPALTDYQRMLKRVFDIAMTLLILPFGLPVMAAAAVLIRLEGDGPILYRTKRMGENGKVFTMYKFRTMVVGAERQLTQVLQPDENGMINHKRENDPRVTRVGRVLRKLSLDELPQIINVLKGDMSLVGPRPELPELVERYNPWQRERFAVPQGMTGWWQVNGRSDRPLHLNTEDDLYYVRNYSIWLDFIILVKTVWVVLRGKGAF